MINKIHQVRVMFHAPITASLLSHQSMTMSALSRFLKMLEQDQERCKDLNHPKETAMKGLEVLLKECPLDERVVTQPHSFQEVMYQLRHKHMLLKRTTLVYSIQLLHSMKTQ